MTNGLRCRGDGSLYRVPWGYRFKKTRKSRDGGGSGAGAEKSGLTLCHRKDNGSRATYACVHSLSHSTNSYLVPKLCASCRGSNSNRDRPALSWSFVPHLLLPRPAGIPKTQILLVLSSFSFFQSTKIYGGCCAVSGVTVLAGI